MKWPNRQQSKRRRTHWPVMLGLLVCSSCASSCLAEESKVVLKPPPLSDGPPSSGKRVAVTAPEYAGTKVFHTVYLPPNWSPKGPRIPIIFEYTGNRFLASGSTGKVEDAGLGFGLSAGKYIWVSLPYISPSHEQNQVTWWGDVDATVDYAKRNVPKIIERFHANTEAVFLCGFSRGAIGVSYVGLHDDQIARLWTAFVTHDHFDGVREWRNTDWGSPLQSYREAAKARLRRVGDRPFLVCQNGEGYGAREFVTTVLPKHSNFQFLVTDTREILGEFPNDVAKSAHTDRWLNVPSRFRDVAWKWMDECIAVRRQNGTPPK